MYSLNMLRVSEPGKADKLYIDGRRVSLIRWDLAHAHAHSQDCFSTESRDGKYFHRHCIRSNIDFSYKGDKA